jgi:autophagy-related protein 5
MGQLKEADFMRWGNTKRMTGLRKAEQDGMWEGVKDRALALSSFLFLRIV